MATRPPFFDQRFTVTNAQGALVPAALHLLYTFESGTTTPKQTFSDAAGLVPNANPIELDAEGRCTMFLGSGAYTMALHDPDDAPVDGGQQDNVTGVPAPTADQFVPLAGGVTMTGLFTLSGNATANLNPVTLQQANSLIAASAATLTSTLSGQFPIGTIAMWLTGTPPTNWLELNGQTVSRATYSALFALWGVAFGVGDGSTTFGLPDSRAEFLRGYDNGRGVDAARVIGSAQTEMVGPHSHKLRASNYQISIDDIPGRVLRPDFSVSSEELVENNTGTENRPRNLAFMLIVRAL